MHQKIPILLHFVDANKEQIEFSIVMSCVVIFLLFYWSRKQQVYRTEKKFQ